MLPLESFETYRWRERASRRKQWWWRRRGRRRREERKSLVSSTHLSCSEYSAILGKAAVAACFLLDHKRLELPLCCHGDTITSRSVATVSVTVALAEQETVTHAAIDANPHLPPTRQKKYNRGKGQAKIVGFASLPTQIVALQLRHRPTCT